MFNNLILFFLSLLLLWIGSGMAVKSVSKIAHSLRISQFVISFFVLGVFTSITEIMVGINAYISNTPEIFIGNLIGSSAVVFLLIVPLVAIIGNGISLKNHSFQYKDLVLTVVVVGLPAMLSIDNTITLIDALLCIVAYGYFVYKQFLNNSEQKRICTLNIHHRIIFTNSIKILISLGIVFIGSNLLVHQTEIIGSTLHVDAFLISVLVISIGTNMPEISIAVRALLLKQKDIAFGNYVGSASLNTLELGVLSVVSKTPLSANGSNFSVVALGFGLILFLFFGKSRNTISRFEGSLILMAYLAFVALELFTGPGWSF